MYGKWARFAVATTLAVAVTGGSALFDAGTAAAATPIVVGDCATTVQGAPGTPVELSPSAVVAPIASLISAIPLLGPSLAQPFTSAFAALPPIPLGALPTGTGVITGGQIANEVVAQLDKIPLLGPVLGTLTGEVQSSLASMCKLTVTGVNAVAAPVQSGTATIAKGSQQVQQALGLQPKSGTAPGTGGTPGQTGTSPGDPGKQGGGGGTASGGGSGGGSSAGLPPVDSPVVGGVPFTGSGDSLFDDGSLLDYGLAESPLARYAGIPFASAGLFASSPGSQYGDVGGSAQPGLLGQGSTIPGDGVQTAGQAEAYDPTGGALGNGVGLPMLLAVLMLSGVTAALVRTWALRRLPR